METRLQNIDKEYLKQRKKLIEELLEEDLSIKEFNQENLLEAKRIAKKYKEAVSDDWNNRPPKVILANSEGTELASISNYWLNIWIDLTISLKE